VLYESSGTEEAASAAIRRLEKEARTKIPKPGLGIFLGKKSEGTVA
jgi:hypothetical protein